MYQPRRASLAVSVEPSPAMAFEAAPRRAGRRPAGTLLSKAVPVIVSLGVLAGGGGIAVAATTDHAAPVAAPARTQDTISRSEDRAALAATSELAAVDEPVADESAPAEQPVTEGAFVAGAWADSFGTVTGTRFAQKAVEVRSRAGDGAPVLTTLAKGAEVKVTDKAVDGWTQVASDSRIGWVPTQQLGAQAPDPVVETPAKGSAGTATAARSGARLAFPAQGTIGSPWGMRMHPILKYKRMHGGVDIGGRSGQPLYAAEDGVVTKAARGHNSGSGNNVRIDHGTLAGQAVETAYLHMDSISVKVGQKVKRGQVIGTMGSTGLSTGPHLHFSLYLNGANSNPAPWLR